MNKNEVILYFAHCLQSSILSGKSVAYHLMDRYTMLEIDKIYKIIEETKLATFK